jgi:hypothetical protein
MVQNKDITVIVPVHIWDDEIKGMFEQAMSSVPEDIKVIVACPKNISSSLSTYENVELAIEDDNDNTSFQHLTNLGVSKVPTEWFSILEFDDVYTKIWFSNFEKYQEYHQEFNIFLPLNDLYNCEDDKDEFVGNGNEVAWASSFSDTIGVLGEKDIAEFFQFYLTGGIFRTSTWRDLGGLKESMKLTFWYEFMLRATHKGEKIYVVPKIGYIHCLARKGSLMQEYRDTISKEESEFWFKTAKAESYHMEDRNIQYVENKETEE